MAYTKTVWANGTTPAINEDNLNKMEQGIYENSISGSTSKDAINEEISKLQEDIGTHNYFNAANIELVVINTSNNVRAGCDCGVLPAGEYKLTFEYKTGQFGYVYLTTVKNGVYTTTGIYSGNTFTADGSTDFIVRTEERYDPTNWVLKNVRVESTSAFKILNQVNANTNNISAFNSEIIHVESLFDELIEDKKVTRNVLPPFFQSGDSRIWYRIGTFDVGTTMAVSDNDYDIAPYSTIGSVSGWSKSITFTDTNYTGIAFRKADKSNISGMTQSEISSKIEYTIYLIIGGETDTFNKFSHFSFDDCVFWADLITNEDVYDSIFDNSFLADLKELHEETGAVFTLNCFCSSSGSNIENCPDKFASEFSENRRWLKFAFHGQDSNARYDTDVVSAITTSYGKFVTGIYSLTGRTDTIDHITRLGYFTGTIANVEAIRDCQCGISGLLTADDTRVSYYLDTTNNNFILAHSKMFDADNKIMFIKSQKRLESMSDVVSYCNNILTPSGSNFERYLEFFTHEYEWNSTLKTKLSTLLNWLRGNGYGFAFWEDVFKM